MTSGTDDTSAPPTGHGCPLDGSRHAEPGDTRFEHGAAFAGVLARMLAAAGYKPRRLNVGLQRGAQDAVELHVIGDVRHVSG